MIRNANGKEHILAPCPFCGKDVADFTNCQELEACEDWKRCPAQSHYMAVVCSCLGGGCGASTGFWPTQAEAADRWNRRAKGAVLTGELICRIAEQNSFGGTTNCTDPQPDTEASAT